jgi:soluble lytic murein transglycosylase-like protein
MTGTQWRLALGLLLSCAGAGASTAPKPSPAEQYFAVRARGQVASAPFDTVRLQPQQWRPYLMEIRGTVTGNARRDDGATLIIESPGAGTYMVEVDADTAAYAAEAGQTVRVLAKVPDGTIVNRLTVVALVTEFDAASYEIQQARKAATAPARPPAAAKSPRSRNSRQQLASRGGIALRNASILQQYAQAVLYFNPRLPGADAMRIAQSIIVYSNRYGLDARLVMAVVAVESNFNATAVSRVGAMGLGQLMPGTAAGLGVNDPWSPEQNIEGATRLLSGHIAEMATKAPTLEAIKLALACYNAGAGAVKKHKGIPPYRETRNYVKKVTRLYYQMCGQPPPAE